MRSPTMLMARIYWKAIAGVVLLLLLAWWVVGWTFAQKANAGSTPDGPVDSIIQVRPR